MGIPAVSFLGRSFRIPGSRAAFRTQPGESGISPELNTLILIGESDNGWFHGTETYAEGQRFMEFGTFAEARAVLRSGTLLDAIKAAFAPSKDERFAAGPQLIRALCVSKNVAATANIPHDGSATYVATHVVPGPYANDVRFRVSNAGERLEVITPEGSNTASGLNAVDLTLLYTGDAATAVFAYDGTTFTVTLTGQSDGTESLSIATKEGWTIGDLAERINGFSGYTATIESNPDVKVADLDHYSAVDAKSLVSIRAQLARQIKALFDFGNIAVTVTGARKKLSDQLSFQFLSGGATAAADPADYLTAIDAAFDRLSGFYVNVCTPIAAVNAYLFERQKHGMTPDGSNERFVGGGAATATDFATRCADAKAINSEGGVYGGVPVELYRADGLTKKIFDPWMLAVLHNAGKAATNVRESMLYKDLNVLSLPEKLTSTQLNKAIDSGLLVADLKPDTGAAKITLDCTTYQKADLIRNKAQTMCLGLALVRDFRLWLQNQYLGETPTDPDAFDGSFTDADIRTAVSNRFRFTYVERNGWLTRNIYTGEAAFDQNFEILRDGNVIYFKFADGNLVTSLDFIFSLLNLGVVRGSSTGA